MNHLGTTLVKMWKVDIGRASGGEHEPEAWHAQKRLFSGPVSLCSAEMPSRHVLHAGFSQLGF